MFTQAVALAALAAVPALAHKENKPAVNVYFGQSGSTSLGEYCESDAFEYVTIAFVNNSPEQDTSGLNYPGTNFGAHCAAEVYTNEDNGKESKLLSQCTFIAADIPKCQAAGKKVLLSVGGGWIEGTNYTVSSAKKGVEFADFLWGSFGPYDESYHGPRPFDFGSNVAVDGFDFDIETKFKDQSGYIALIDRLHEHYEKADGDYVVAGAPQCPLSDDFFQMKEMIVKAKFDLLWIQFYNNKGCDAIPNNDGFGEHFNYDEWELFLKGTASRDAKLFIGLPGSAKAAGSGYLEPEEAIALFKEYKNRPSFGGAMIWDVNFGSEELESGKTYIENIHDYLCPPEEPITTTSETISSTATTEPYPTSTEETTSTTDEPSYSTENPVESQTSDGYSTATQTSEAQPTTTASESYPTEYPTELPSESTSDAVPTTTGDSSSTEAYPTEYPTELPSESTSDAVPTTTGDSSPTEAYPTEAYPTETDDWDYCDDDEDDEPTDYPTAYPTTTGDSSPTEAYPTEAYPTEAYPTETEVCDDDDDDEPTGYSTAYPTGTESATSDVYPTTAEATDSYPTMTTSTVYTTTVHTITSCAPTVTNCPVGEVTTETIPAYTTVCPVEEETSYPVTKEVIATVVPVPNPSYSEEGEAPTTVPGGVGGYPQSSAPIASFSTVTVSNYPTGGGAGGEEGPSYTESQPAGGYYPSGNPTAQNPYPTGGYPTAVVSGNSPVTAGAGRIAAAVGIPAAMVAAMLLL